MTGHKKLSLLAILVAFFAVGCRQDMHDQPRIDALEGHDFFTNGMGARELPEGTVARGQLRADTHLYEGKDAAGDFVDALPAQLPLSRELLVRGQDRYGIYCTPCHDATGSGRGMIVRRGLKQPTAFHEARLQAMPLGYFYDVMTNGYGIMSSYKVQVPVEDRWAIAAYIRALQASQTQPLNEMSAAEQQEFHDALAAAAAPPAEKEHGGHH